jgi:hypothetical protein
VQAAYNIISGVYVINNVLSFSIADGPTDFEIGDTFTFITTRDQGLKIKDVLVDAVSNQLYAVTYFWGELESHAVGNVYSISLDPATGEPIEPWQEATLNLPEFAPPGDTTLFAQHVMAMDNTPGQEALYIGGEGMNFYKALTTHPDSDFADGLPYWQNSNNGELGYRIMARMPILFSGQCTMTVFRDPAVPAPGDPVVFSIYTQDANGNPPIAGSKVTVKQKVGPLETVIFTYTYSDGYTGPGTWRDLNDPTTDLPHVVSGVANAGTKYIFDFVPRCEEDPVAAPGCSGGLQQETIEY